MSDRFPVGRATVDGKPVVTRSVTCGQCGRSEQFVDTARTSMADTVIAKRARFAGWSIARQKRKDRCPACAHPVKQPKEPKIVPVAMTPPTPAAAPPRTATVADRRRILDHLEAAYDIDRGWYRDDGSDQKSADALQVPRAWVAEVRGGMFGEDRNEARDARLLAIGALQVRLTQCERQIEEHFSKLTDAVAKLRSELGAIK
jgi:hypothetical protein